MSESNLPKRLIIKNAIEAGHQTRESLMKVADVNSAGLSSQFSYLRLMGFFPVASEDGVFKFITRDEWDAQKAAVKTKPAATPKSPTEWLELASKQFEKAKATVEKTAKRFKDLETEEAELKHTIATAQVRLAELNVAAAEEAVLNMGEALADPETAEVDENDVNLDDEDVM